MEKKKKGKEFVGLKERSAAIGDLREVEDPGFI